MRQTILSGKKLGKRLLFTCHCVLRTMAWTATVINKKFPPVHRCIYCGLSAIQAKLTSEHIIPFGLNGYMRLPASSCVACADITKQFEQTCQRLILGEARVHLGTRTRNKSTRPTTFTARVMTDDGLEERVLAIEDHSFKLVMIEFVSHPNIIAGGRLGKRHSQLRLKIRDVYEDIQDRISRQGHGVQFEHVIQIDAFCGMLAKIAHSYAVAVLGSTQFEPVLLPLIAGINSNLSDCVGGGGMFRKEHERKHFLHNIELYPVWLPGDKFFFSRPLIVAELQLFACFGGPIYLVVVGRHHLSGPLQLLGTRSMELLLIFA